MTAKDEFLEFYKQYIKDEFSRMNDSQLRLEGKLDDFSCRTSECFKEIRDSMEDKHKEVEVKLQGHSEKLIKHEQTWNIASIAVTTFGAGILGAIAYFWDIITGKQ